MSDKCRYEYMGKLWECPGTRWSSLSAPKLVGKAPCCNSSSKSHRSHGWTLACLKISEYNQLADIINVTGKEKVALECSGKCIWLNDDNKSHCNCEHRYRRYILSTARKPKKSLLNTTGSLCDLHKIALPLWWDDYCRCALHVCTCMSVTYKSYQVSILSLQLTRLLHTINGQVYFPFYS